METHRCSGNIYIQHFIFLFRFLLLLLKKKGSITKLFFFFSSYLQIFKTPFNKCQINGCRNNSSNSIYVISKSGCFKCVFATFKSPKYFLVFHYQHHSANTKRKRKDLLLSLHDNLIQCLSFFRPPEFEFLIFRQEWIQRK